MALAIAVTGAIGSGKTTLAASLAAAFSALHVSSDGVRLDLSGKQRRNGARVFAELHRRFTDALAERRAVVLDSTGMSPRFRALLRVHRRDLIHVHLILADAERFEERERARSDRPEGSLPRAAFRRSKQVAFHDDPDLTVQTDDRTPDDVFALVMLNLSQRGIVSDARAVRIRQPER